MSDAPAQDQAEPNEPFVEGLAKTAEAAPVPEGTLIVDLDGYEGPLDVLLALARNQRVDLTHISILKLAEQYLEFVNQAQRLELELAADYLVMASWLAYLKSKLLLPPPEEEEGPSGEEMAARLAFQLQRLEAMRNASKIIFSRKRLGVHVFSRGAPEGIRVVKTSTYTGSLYDLLKSYSTQRLKHDMPTWEPTRLPIMTIELARHRLESMLGMMFDWGRIESLLPTDRGGATTRSTLASTLSAALVLAKEGQLEIRQSGAFSPLFMRRREVPPEPLVDAPNEGSPETVIETAENEFSTQDRQDDE
ncbi:MAG: segregation/condensation protein A [Rhizobiales bacterium]|nr:segregation/condensation protein A [Hyphomicrobiales bacterium]